jgi:hypothetical protein
MQLKDIPIRPMSDEECREIIAKFGGYEAYLSAVRGDRPPPKPQLVRKSYAELTAERIEWHAKQEGLTLEQYLSRHPEKYEEYLKVLDTVRAGARVVD